MSGNSAEFLAAAAKSKSLKARPSDDDLLALYSLYKQATIGDVNIACPGITDLKGKAKWSAWEGRKGLSKADAETQYIELVAKFEKQYGTK